MRGLKYTITLAWAKLITGKRSTTEHRCEDRSIEDIQHQMLNLQASVDALTAQIKAAETRSSASTERVSTLESQLYKRQVNRKLGIGLMHL
jgi:uncharacterized protein YlxW (UPF0749 family)